MTSRSGNSALPEARGNGGRPRVSFLHGVDFMRLNDACIRITEAFGEHPYLVGSVTRSPDFRDVDVRSILADDDFDARFGEREFFWSLFCMAVSEYLRVATGLPVDFQVQRQSKSEKYAGDVRCAMGFPARLFAGGGDAT